MFSSVYVLAGLQMLMAAFVLGMAELVPPPAGPMLLVSTTGMHEGEILKRALAAGALPLGNGPISGSMVVYGERSVLAAEALPHGILVLAGSPGLCGGTA